MCNIAGYNGTKNAAPILLEMLRRQEPYDGGMSTGVATIHQGKLHYRKIVGDVETLIRETDVLSLPGTIGIAHTRPFGTKGTLPMHPNFNMEETMALVTNGTTPKNPYESRWNEAVDMLVEKGYVFKQKSVPTKKRAPLTSRDGMLVAAPEARVFLADYYIKEGKTPEEALALACAHMYSDNVSVMIGESFPDRICLARTTRPMVAKLAEDGVYIATCRFAFPAELSDLDGEDLPLHHSVSVYRDGFFVHREKMNVEPVCPVTPKVFREAMNRIEGLLLQSRENPLYFDELEFFVRDHLADVWQEPHTFTQHARVVYDVLWQLEQEGRLKKVLRMQERKTGLRPRYYFWLEA
ncbi:MAG: hypothetical protein IKJ74_02680 [Clostridia bacterium]|nr:hypothetical protein [Clostridia bacterium]